MVFVEASVGQRRCAMIVLQPSAYTLQRCTLFTYTSCLVTASKPCATSIAEAVILTALHDVLGVTYCRVAAAQHTLKENDRVQS